MMTPAEITSIFCAEFLDMNSSGAPVIVSGLSRLSSIIPAIFT